MKKAEGAPVLIPPGASKRQQTARRVQDLDFWINKQITSSAAGDRAIGIWNAARYSKHATRDSNAASSDSLRPIDNLRVCGCLSCPS
ncbi:hypothetical protein FIBSPDRAFT_17504 [Athelia psychrophila]|uniref:Uncharacterized protein n=1 Tax=Athelia psychrophila TaxID=1759441 RepID=A0A166UA31_9AGAM|nr:hypothetical protein FIBSPDRAFT_17504 [Fibularhizoctonia sp. CBS 109695]